LEAGTNPLNGQRHPGRKSSRYIVSITCAGKAKPVLTEDDQTIIAECRYGKGYVLAVGDPWIYNEYIGHSRLPKDFENMQAAGNLVRLRLAGGVKD